MRHSSAETHQSLPFQSERQGGVSGCHMHPAPSQNPLCTLPFIHSASATLTSSVPATRRSCHHLGAFPSAFLSARDALPLDAYMADSLVYFVFFSTELICAQHTVYVLLCCLWCQSLTQKTVLSFRVSVFLVFG